MNCKVCGKEIPATGKRGRPAQICPECKAKAAEGKKKRAPKAVVPAVEPVAAPVAVEPAVVTTEVKA